MYDILAILIEKCNKYFAGATDDNLLQLETEKMFSGDCKSVLTAELH